MKNWSGRIQWQPEQLLYPKSEAEIQAGIQKAIRENKKVRIIGTGHSFNPLWVTSHVLISLDEFQGVVKVDKERKQVVVKAGTKLSKLGDLLNEQGLAMENLGDIDAQSIGGTIGTGTHGTGLQFGSISTQVIGIRLINGRGEAVYCSEEENRDLFKAAQVSLGLLGIITEITLQCVPAYKLQLQNSKEILTEVMKTLEDRHKNNRNFEFYFFPYSNKAWTKTSNIAIGQADKFNIFNYLTEYFLENYIFKILCEFARFFPSQNALVARISANSIPNIQKVYQSHKVYATTRLVRFNEMEYSVPIAAHPEVIRDIRKLIDKHKFAVHFPIENRVVRKDDIYLSPAYGRDSAYIACHVYNKKDYRHYFAKLEEVFKAYEGRPHWGKMHTMTADDLAERYPRLEDFRQQQEAQDPEGIFFNDYLKNLFYVAK